MHTKRWHETLAADTRTANESQERIAVLAIGASKQLAKKSKLVAEALV